MNQVLKALAAIRKADYSVEEIAFRTGMTAEDILAIESGKSDPTMSEVRRYANAMGIAYQYKLLSK